MSWVVGFHPALDEELQNLTDAVQEKLYASARLIEQFGPTLGRPRVDTLNGARHRNMKELRFSADGGVWRVAFAFDAGRKAILLVAGDKSKTEERRFYARLIREADERFASYLEDTGGGSM